MLAAQFRAGKQSVHLKSTAKLTLQSATGDESLSYTQNIDTHLGETVLPSTPEGTHVRLTIQKFAVGVTENGKAPETSPEFQRAVQRDVGLLGLSLVYNSQGNVAQRSIDVGRVPPASREILNAIGKQLQESLETASIPLPGGQVTPGQSWKARRRLPILAPDRFSAAAIEMTYTYRGMRNIAGKDVAVLDLRGAFLRAAGGAESLKGVITGEGHVDPETGMVLLARTHAEVTISTTYRRTKFEAKGTLESRLERGTGVQ